MEVSKENIEDVKKHFIQLSELLLGLEKEQSEQLRLLLNTSEKLVDYIKDSKLGIIYITQEIEKEEEGKEKAVVNLEIKLFVEYKERMRGIAIIKNKPKSFVNSIIQKQKMSRLFTTIQLGGTNPYKMLHSYISQTFEPFFLSFIKQKEDQVQHEKKKKAIPKILDHFDGLKVTLYQCQETFHIPQIDIKKYIHADLKKAISEGVTVGHFKFTKATVDQMEDSIAQLGKDLKKIVESFHEDPEIPDTISEINYWSSLDVALKSLKEKINSNEIKQTLATLRDHRKNKVTLVFEDYKNSLYSVSQKASSYYRSFIKDLPIFELKSCKDFTELTAIIDKVFGCLRKIKSCDYPIKRAFQLVKAITGDIIDQVVKILETYSILELPFTAFDKLTGEVMTLFGSLRQSKDILRTILKSQTSKSFKEKIVDEATINLEKRILEIRKFRREHNELQLVIEKVFSFESFKVTDVNPLEQVQYSYQIFVRLGTKLFDISSEGEKNYKNAWKKYNESVEGVEKVIIRTIRDRLGSAKNAAESFRVFSQFNVLFYKEGIRNSVQAYQKQLISQVKIDIEKLEEKFKKKYTKSEVFKLSEVRDVPQVSGAIIWAKQIERQLDTYVKRIEAVVGKGWERLQLLRRDVSWILNESLSEVIKIPLLKLQNSVRKIKVFKKATPEIIGTAIVISYLKIVFPESENEWREMVDESKQQLEKDEKECNLTPGNALNSAEALLKDELNVAKRQQKELIGKCNLIKKKLQENIDNSIHQWNKNIISILKNGNWKILKIGMNNESADSVIISDDIFEIVETKDKGTLDLRVNFHHGVVELLKEYKILSLGWLKLRDKIDKIIMKTVVNAHDIYPYYLSFSISISTYKRLLSKIGESVKPLAAGNMNKVQSLLKKGFEYSWKKAHTLMKFSTQIANAVHLFKTKTVVLLQREKKINSALEKLKTCTFKELQEHIRIIQQTVDQMNLEEDDYSNLKIWVTMLNENVENILKNRLIDLIMVWKKKFLRLSHGVDEGIEHVEKEENDYFKENPFQPFLVQIKLVNQKLKAIPSVQTTRIYWYTNLHSCFSAVCNLPKILSDRYDVTIQEMMGGADTYSYLLSKIKHDIVREVYEMIDSKMNEVRKYIQKWLQYQALYSIDSFTIASQLGSKLTSWMDLLNGIKDARKESEAAIAQQDFGAVIVNFKDVQSKIHLKYDKTLKDMLVRFRGKLGKKGKDFYNIVSENRKLLESIDLNTKDGGISFLSEQTKISGKMEDWKKLMKSVEDGEKMLEQSRIKLKEGWIYAQMIKGEWESFLGILKMREDTMNLIKPKLVQSVYKEYEKLKDIISQILKDWKVSKPIGDQSPQSALTTLSTFELKIQTLKDKCERISIANKILNLDLKDMDDEIKPIKEEIESLREVWQNLKVYYDGMSEIRDTQLRAILPKSLKKKLENFLDEIKKTSDWMQSYEPVLKFKEMVSEYKRTIPILADLRTEAMETKHWIDLQRKLGTKWNIDELTVGDIWKTNVLANEKFYQEIITIAKGELVLRVFLREIKEKWAIFKFTLVNFNNRCFLVKGWDEFFEEVNDSLKSLSSTRASPYFKSFKKELIDWETKLSNVNFICDIWMDVQRVWVYLEGVFVGNNDIKVQLPQETQKFRIIDKEFITMMRKVHKNPIVMDILEVKNIDKQFEKLHAMLLKIQKSLGEYLEKQRQAFPRFYFVGDEDLLEIIGHTGDPFKVQKHLKKMFAGISQLLIKQVKDKEFSISGMQSKEGEVVKFMKNVKMTPEIKINTWLGNVEGEMRNALSSILVDSVKEMEPMYKIGNFGDEKFGKYLHKYPDQIMVCSVQVIWTKVVESTITSDLKPTLDNILKMLSELASFVLKIENPIDRIKIEHLITELVHQRDVVRHLIQNNVNDTNDFSWKYWMRFYLKKTETYKDRLEIKIANAKFFYGFEYLGITDKLVQTPLTDRCYLALTQALFSRQGGSPFGPAGTGKTETVKMLGAMLGRLCFVFNCDENFDFKAMGRIFVGLCQCGAWGCFDEFNRLNEKILSAVSQQILQIQTALRDNHETIELINRKVRVCSTTGVFITMNPGYAGRSQLPQNLKQLFRSIAMVKPDQEIIAEVIMFSQGFVNSEKLAKKIVLFFNLCGDELSAQSHYDFGLRALKNVLVNAGFLKRLELNHSIEAEQKILIRSVLETVTPKLVGEDKTILKNLLVDLFPGANLELAELKELREKIREIAERKNLIPDESWVEKVIQLYQIQIISHGVILVGPAGCGKSTCWKVMVEAIEELDKKEGNEKRGVCYIIDPKAISKEELYGVLDSTTREWTDGIFTHILRKIIDNLRGESEQRHWIIFDGDVDPEWVENLNSVLDCNKLFTLPNGERLSIPKNVRIFFEVRNLDYATLATVSRCGMVWYGNEVLSLQMVLKNYLEKLKHECVDKLASIPSDYIKLQIRCAKFLKKYLSENSIAEKAVICAEKKNHIMKYSRYKALNAVFALINKGIMDCCEFEESNNAPLTDDHLERYITKRLLFSLFWGIGCSMLRVSRNEFSDFIKNETVIPTPAGSFLEFEVVLEDGEWRNWKDNVPNVDVEPKSIITGAVIPTSDTAKHSELLASWIRNERCVILCGPPGSGKTMILTEVLKCLPNFVAIPLNFSSASSPDLILKTFEQHFKVVASPGGLVLRPVQEDKKIVIFCDEINLPANDKYGTQRVITFIRQIVEQKGYWRASDKAWVTVERLYFVGACNPPTDPGRVVMTPRFLRHTGILYVDFPGKDSLLQIYGTFVKSLFKLPQIKNVLRGLEKPTTDALVNFYSFSQQKFTTELQPHYIYSPRELTRWLRALHEGVVKGPHNPTTQDFIRLVAHEGLRIFADRLVLQSEKDWTYDTMDKVINEQYPRVEEDTLQRPILYTFLYETDSYISVDRETLKEFIQDKMNSFAEEQLDTKLVLFDSVLEHVLRIDRVLRQPLGHLLLAGVSGAGKTVLPKFVAWFTGYEVFQIKAHSRYTLLDFEEDLRKVLKEAGINSKKICFIFDEANVLEPSFLEYMNALLASGEVPGLFEDEELQALLNQCKSVIQSVKIDTDEEIYQWFIEQVQKNLHIVFTINPVGVDFKNRQCTSPALFNRCVVDWFGDWSENGLRAVGNAFAKHINLEDMPRPSIVTSDESKSVVEKKKHDLLIDCFVKFHNTVKEFSTKLAKTGIRNFVTPRDYLDFIMHFDKLHQGKIEQLKEQQNHLEGGLRNLKDTEVEVARLKAQLEEKRKRLKQKNDLAQEKLKKMVKEQQIAEKRKQESEVFQKELVLQEKEMSIRKSKAEEDLSKVEPMLQEAKRAVENIKKKHLDEMRALRNPPTIIKKVLEAVVILLEGKSKLRVEWITIRNRLQKAGFKKEVTEFSSTSIDEKMRKKMKKLIATLNVDAAERASVACGPLAKWLVSQIEYAEILLKVEPLTKEVKIIRVKYDKLKIKQDETEKSLKELELRIAVYEEEYSKLISDSQVIKSEMETVQVKVDRSFKLLASLSAESQRWSFQSKEFLTELECVAGNVLLSSAFLCYIGNFDEFLRRIIFKDWKNLLKAHEVKFKNDFQVIGYLTDAKTRLNWGASKLPVDDLYVENAIMLNRFNRYPLVIDPTGTAVDFLMESFKDKKIVKTSFLDSGFLKNLETSLRFGTPLLVEDAEKIDPILNPILNREIIRHGGRNLVRLASQDIDFSDNFRLFMSTRDPTFGFSVDLMSRVTMVNFTVTPASLQSQCLNIILKSEKPEIEKQRNEQLKLQGEYAMKLRKLEDDLLTAITNAKGNLLEDEKLMATLESLKKSGKEISEKVETAERNMKKFEDVRNTYLPLASFCSKIYFSLEVLQDIHFLYHFSLEFFLEILHHILKKKGLEIEELINKLFQVLYERTSRSLLHEDRLTFALKLAEIRISNTPDEIPKDEYSLLLTSGRIFKKLLNVSSELNLTNTQLQLLTEISHLKGFKDIENIINRNLGEWKEFINSVNFEGVPKCWDSSNSAVIEEFRKLLIVKTLRPDFFTYCATVFISQVFGKGFLKIDVNLDDIVFNEVSSHTPLLLISLPGYDASTEVQELSWGKKKTLKAIAMGSSEGYEDADVELPDAIRYGKWLLLKNIHLSPSYVIKVEKLLHEKKSQNRIHQDFRLFLTAEVHKSIPVNLLRRAYKIVYEPAPGIKANISQSFSALNKEIVNREPVERGKLYLLAAWFHAIVQERLRFVPLGWTKYYEFTQGDLKWSFDAIDKWVDIKAKGKSNVQPSKLPWKALHTLIGESIYGGKLDNEFDSKILKSFIDKFFDEKCYKENFKFYEDKKDDKSSVVSPSGMKFDEFIEWLDTVPPQEKPEWLGLPSNVRLMTLTKKTQDVIRKLGKVQDTRGSFLGVGIQKAGGELEAADSLWNPIKTAVDSWESILPKELNLIKLQNIKDESHLFRCFSREVNSGEKLLRKIQADIEELKDVCSGKEKPNTDQWYLNDCIKKQIIPKKWRTFQYLDTVTLNEWVADLARRFNQLNHIVDELLKGKYCKEGISLGRLLFPEAYISATRQDIAHETKQALETLKLEIEIGDNVTPDKHSFIMNDLSINCATWKDGKLIVDKNLENKCPKVKIKWVAERKDQKSLRKIPLYLNKSRKQLLGSFYVKSDIEENECYRRGISFLSWNDL